MQTLSKIRDEVLDRVPRTGASPVKKAERKGRGAARTGQSFWSSIRSAVVDAFKGVTGRKQAERRRKRTATAAAAGAATATGAAGLYLAKRSRDASTAEQPAAPQAFGPPVPNPNGQAADVVSSTGTTPA